METLIDFMCKPWLGTILGIVGLCVAIFFYFHSRKITKLAFQSDTVTLLGSAHAAFPEELEIRFSGVPVPRVTAERVAMWNAGNTTIEGQQIVSSDMLRIELKEGSEILKIDVLKATREVNAFRLVPREGDRRIVDIFFDYLDPEDGFSFEIVHTGERRDLELLGTLRGIPTGLKNYGRSEGFFTWRLRRVNFPDKGSRIVFMIGFLLGLIIMFIGLFSPYFVIWSPSFAENSNLQDPTSPNWLLVLAGALYSAMQASLLWIPRKHYPASLDIHDSVKGSRR